MKIAILIPASSTHPGSMNRYAHCVLEAAKTISGVEVDEIRLLKNEQTSLPSRKKYSVMINTIRRHIWDYDAIHLTDGSYGLLLNFLPKKIRKCTTVHDVIPHLQSIGRLPERPGFVARLIIKKSLDALKKNDALLVDSEHTANDLKFHTPVSNQKVQRLYPPVEPVPDPNLSVDREPSILHIGNSGFYKNRLGVIRTFAQVREQQDVRLKLAGAPLLNAERELIAQLDLEPVVDSIPHPEDAQLIGLYRSCSLLLFPSIYEGFGWPPLEAMAHGCPVVSSNRASLPEVVGDAALTADPDDIPALANQCCSILNEPEIRNQLQTRGLQQIKKFSRESFATGLHQFYQDLVNTARG